MQEIIEEEMCREDHSLTQIKNQELRTQYLLQIAKRITALT